MPKSSIKSDLYDLSVQMSCVTLLVLRDTIKLKKYDYSVRCRRRRDINTNELNVL